MDKESINNACEWYICDPLQVNKTWQCYAHAHNRYGLMVYFVTMHYV